ncbi:malate synthase G [Psychrobium sp. 1_MG-2023]|uniref:malate synthase G n=1 Tax=Psychrobium sp. 1_MG-2023 TaxID=3062624 RepID=UPI000C32B682|nr:malate synthase G [Psychrobium sp. 1_MG-2023]MDP2560082.1 malate synthase G [Psychrobium sp. 1_MG-2023]PKF56259.1 malate synthase G [Alteromonadales bacterium alter-6D02]
MTQRVTSGGLQVAQKLFDFINQQALPQTGIAQDHFWASFEKIINEFAPRNKALLAKRDDIQQKIDTWHKNNQYDFANYKAFLQEIDYLLPPCEDFKVTTSNVDPEMATMAGPQLVVPVMNSRFALNAANARWGSLYDGLYGTDAISEEDGASKTAQYNPVRGNKVIAEGRDFLNAAVALASGTHTGSKAYTVVNGQLQVELENGDTAGLQDPSQFIGFTGNSSQPQSILLKNNGLHIDVQIDPSSDIGQADSAGVSDIVLESALTTIMDCEDSIAAVDADDKVVVYSNWLGLMKGDLQEELTKGGKTITRKLNEDRHYTAANGSALSLKGRSLMFVRNVGHLMTNEAILDSEGNEVPEGILDGVITSLISLHDVKGNGKFSNTTTGSVYIVKPKMHGPEEVAFADDLFNAIEDAYSLERHTIKMGIMDEERRTTVNLKQCIKAAQGRVVFINTGFLDRTGDEIHTSMEAGPMIRKGDMKAAAWIGAYENWNVDMGLACGLSGKAQIGKGMWAIPDQMANMLEAKVAHPLSGANTAWVPSPTAATLHAMHYHQVDVFARQQELAQRELANIDDILSIPVAQNPNWSDEEVQQELDNNAQGILGYVVRWVDAGIGCSKVPDINNVGLMEDRATLRISSQHIANWLHHDICSADQVMATMKKMAAVVDGQNASDPTYQPMATDFAASIAFQAACELVFEGCAQPSGYTEPVLHRRRIELKASL